MPQTAPTLLKSRNYNSGKRNFRKWILLQKMNISQINFIHDEAIISDINVLKDIANITVISDPSRFLPIINNEASETRNSISELAKTPLRLLLIIPEILFSF